MKQCSNCHILKESSDFSSSKINKDGIQGICKLCAKDYAKRWYSNNKQHVKDYQLANIEKIIEYRKKKYKENAEVCNERSREWYLRNRESVIIRVINWKTNHPEQVRENWNRAGIKKLSTPRGRLNHNVTSGVYKSLSRGSKKNRSWGKLLGFTLVQLKAHLEKSFRVGMSWDNYGTYWHIDHIIPVSAFNFDKPEDIDFGRCWSLKNLQPLESKLNIIKSNHLEQPFQPSLTIAL